MSHVAVPTCTTPTTSRQRDSVGDRAVASRCEDGAMVVSAFDMAREFDAISEAMGTTDDLQDSLRRVVRLAVDVLEPCTYASVTRVRRGTTGLTLASSDVEALRIDAIQYDVMDGPCWQMAVEDEPDVVWTHDVNKEARWPDFVTRAVTETDVRTVLAFGLAPGLERTALNIYGVSPHSFTSDDVGTASLFAIHSQVVLRQLAAEQRADHLATALGTSRTIGSAVGMIMWIHKIDEAMAFDVLRRASQNLNIRLRDLAETITTTGEVPQM